MKQRQAHCEPGPAPEPLSDTASARRAEEVLVQVAVMITSTVSNDGTSRRYAVIGQAFFTSADQFVGSVAFKETIERVVTRAHSWDSTAISSLDKVVMKSRREGIDVDVLGLNEASATMVGRFALHDTPDAVAAPTGH